MNKTVLVGRITKDVEIRLVGQKQTPCVQFTVAVDRPYKDADGNKQTDFINCVAWSHQANYLNKYAHKGDRVGVSGSIQTRLYKDKDDKNVYVVEVFATEVELLESRREETPKAVEAPIAPKEEIIPESLPFDF